MIELFAQFGVGHFAVLLVACLNVVEQWHFGCIVAGAELLCALKHQVLKIVCQTGGFGRVVA